MESEFLLNYIHDAEFRRAILIALNRGEAFNNLYRAITVLRKGELHSKNRMTMEIWNQCTRLIATVILYYNTYILNELYQRTNDTDEKSYLASLSPCAWTHINLLGHYQFTNLPQNHNIEQMIKQFQWQKTS